MKPSNRRLPLQAEEYFDERLVYPKTCQPELDQILGCFPANRMVSRATRIMTVGSCFAQELKKWLIRNEYGVMGHECGVVYSPRSIRQIIQYSFEPESWNPVEPYWIMDDRFYDPYRKADDHSGPALLGETEAEAVAARKAHYQRNGDILRNLDVAVFTLGLTEYWRNRTDKAAFYSIPWDGVYDPDLHEFSVLSFRQVLQELKTIVNLFDTYNPPARILLSVSPVPLHRTYRPQWGPYIATSYSKSILHAATMEVVDQFEKVNYMPSYEIARANPSAAFREDGRHVQPGCLNQIMEAFSRLYVKSA